MSTKGNAKNGEMILSRNQSELLVIEYVAKDNYVFLIQCTQLLPEEKVLIIERRLILVFLAFFKEMPSPLGPENSFREIRESRRMASGFVSDHLRERT